MKILLSILLFSFLLLCCVQPTDTDVNTAGNNDPVINSITIDPVFIRVGTTTTVTVDATDSDGDALSYSWSVALGDIIGSGRQVRYTAAFCCVGINTINVVVKDSKGATVRGTKNVEINP
jgi:PBP1b-binding outer membrane lipoprotein LpoB